MGQVLPGSCLNGSDWPCLKTRKGAGPPVRFAVDGKELRGSIQPGHTRGEVYVSAVAHGDQQVVGQTFYSGTKESERPAVSKLLAEQHLCHQKITLDALHRAGGPDDPPDVTFDSYGNRALCGRVESQSG